MTGVNTVTIVHNVCLESDLENTLHMLAFSTSSLKKFISQSLPTLSVLFIYYLLTLNDDGLNAIKK